MEKAKLKADVATVDGHGIGIGGKGDDAGAVLELDVTDFDFFGEGSGVSLGIERLHFDEVLAMGSAGQRLPEDHRRDPGDVWNGAQLLEVRTVVVEPADA